MKITIPTFTSAENVFFLIWAVRFWRKLTETLGADFNKSFGGTGAWPNNQLYLGDDRKLDPENEVSADVCALRVLSYIRVQRKSAPPDIMQQICNFQTKR